MLQEAYIRSVGGRGYRNGKIIDIGDDEALGYTVMEGRDVGDE